jgi:hypothetical protein
LRRRVSSRQRRWNGNGMFCLLVSFLVDEGCAYWEWDADHFFEI